MDKWSLYTADVKPEASGADKGKKVLRMTDFSSQSTLFISAWDPIGPDGFSDTYSSGVSKALSDQEYEANPVTGIMMPLRCELHRPARADRCRRERKDRRQDPVPATAVLWNGRDQKWESGYVYADLKGDGSTYGYLKAPTAITAYCPAPSPSSSANGMTAGPIDINDYRYALSMP